MDTGKNSVNGEQEHLTRAEILVFGDVQETGYRGTILPMARRLKLRGFVENLPDGTVRIIAEGPREKIKSFIEDIDIQNAVIEVEKIDVEFSEATGEFKWFQVKYSDMVSEIFQGFGTAKNYFDKIGEKIDRVGDKVDKVADLVVQGNKELKDELSQFRQESNANFQGLDEKYHTVSDELKGIRKALEKRLTIEEEKVKYSTEKEKPGDGAGGRV